MAPWADEPGGEDLPTILQRLRGEWPCVPFGADGNRQAKGEWPGSTPDGTVDPLPHGFSSNNQWQFEADGNGAIALSIHYPEGHPIHALRRRVIPDPGSAALDIELDIDVRADCKLPIGLHPSFRLPAQREAMRIEVGADVTGMTFPGPVDDSSILKQVRSLTHGTTRS